MLLRLQVGCGVSGAAAVVSADLAIAHVVFARDAPPFGSSTPAAGASSATDGKRSRQPAGGYSAYGYAGEYKRPGEAANKEKAPCRHCGRICSVSGRGLKQHEAICARRPGADGPAPTSSSTSVEHVLLVQRLEEHMATHGLTQERVAKAMKLSSSVLSMWFGRARARLSATTGPEIDAQVAAYLDDSEATPSTTGHLSFGEQQRLYDALEAATLCTRGCDPVH